MNRIPEEIKSSIPGELVPAVEALNETLDDAYFKCGRVTEVFCYGLLHPGENLAEIEQHKFALGQLKTIVGPTVSSICDQQIRMGTAPASFHAMNEFYIAGISTQAIQVFHDLLAIGSANSEQVPKPYIQWARGITLDLVKSYEHCVKMWIRAVCDPPDYSTDLNWDDVDEAIMGKTWCAPMLLVMQPSRFMPFDPARQWERVDRQTSKQWLNSFAEMFTIGVKIHIDRIAREKTVELAKHPRPAPETNAAVSRTTAPVESNPAPAIPATVNLKQGHRRIKIEERNKKIRAEFRKLEKRRPGMSSVWYSQQLANSEIASGLDAETIRKIIRD